MTILQNQKSYYKFTKCTKVNKPCRHAFVPPFCFSSEVRTSCKTTVLVPSVHASFKSWILISPVTVEKIFRWIVFLLISQLREHVLAMKNCNKKLNSMYVWNQNELQSGKRPGDAWDILALPLVYKCSVKCSREISANLELVWHANIQKLSFLTFMYCSMAPG